MPRPDTFTGPGPPPDPGREASQQSPAREGHVITYNLAVDLSPSARVMRSTLPVQTQSRLEIPDSRTNSPYSIKSTSESISRCSSAARLYIGTNIPITPRMSRSGRASGRNSNIPTPILLQTQTEEGNVSPTSCSRELTPSIDVERPISSGMDSSRASSTRLSRLPVATGNRPKTARMRGQKPPSPESTSESTSLCSSAARLYIGTKIPITPRMSRSGRASGRNSNIPTPILLQTQTEEGNVSPISCSRELTPSIDVERPISSDMDSSRASTERSSRLPVATGNRPKTSRMRGQKPPSPAKSGTMIGIQGKDTKIPVLAKQVTESKTNVVESKPSVVENKIQPRVEVVDVIDSNIEGVDVVESNTEVVDVVESNTEVVDVVDSNSEVEDVVESNSEVEDVVDSNSEVEDVVDSNSEVEDVVDSNSEVEDVVDSNSEVEDVVDSNSEVEDVVDSNSEVEDFVESNTEVVDVVESNTEVVDVVDSNSEVVDVVDSNTELVDVVDSNSEVVDVVDSNSEVEDVVDSNSEVEDVVDSNSEVEDVVESNTEVVDVVESNTEVVDVVESNIEVEDVVDSNSEVEDVVDSNSEVEDVVESNTEVVDVVDSNSEVEDVVDSNSEVEDVVEFNTEVVDVVDSNSEVEDVVDSNSEVEDVVDSNSEVEEVVDSNIEVKDVVDSNSEVEDVVDSNSEVEEVVDSNIEVKDVVDSNSEVEDVVDSNSEVEDVVESNTEVVDVVDSNSEVEDVVDSNSEVEDVVDSNSEVEDVVESNTEVVDVVESNTEVVDVVESNIEVEDVVDSNSEVEDVVDSNSEVEDVVESNTEVVDVVDSNSEVEDVVDSNSEVEDVVEFNTEVVDVVDSNSEVEDVVDSNSEVEDVVDSNSEVEEVVDSNIEVKDVVDSNSEVEDVVDSNSEVEDVVESNTEVVDVVESNTEVVDVVDSNSEVEDVVDSNIEVEDVVESNTEVVDVVEFNTEVVDVVESNSEVEDVVDSNSEVEDVVDSNSEDEDVVDSNSEVEDVVDSNIEVEDAVDSNIEVVYVVESNMEVAEAKEGVEESKIPDEDTEVTIEIPVDIPDSIKEAEPDVDINKTNVDDKLEEERMKYVFEEQIISTEVELRKKLRNLDEILEAMLEKRSEVDRLAAEFRELYVTIDEQDVMNGVYDQREEMEKFRSLCSEAECIESKFSFFPQDYIAKAMEEQKCESKNQEISANDVKHLFERINAAEKNSADDGLNETQIASMVEKFVMGSAKYFEHEFKDSLNTDAVVDRFASNECDVATTELNSSIDAIMEKYELNEHQVNDNTDIVQRVASPIANFSIDMYETFRDSTKHAQLLDTIEEYSEENGDDNAEQTHNDSVDSDRRGTAEKVNATGGHESQTIAKEKEETQIRKKYDRIEDVPETNLTANAEVLDCCLVRNVCESGDEKMCDIRKSSRCHRNEIAPTTGIDRLDISGDLHEMRKELLSKYATLQEEENELDNESDNKTNEMNLVFAWNEYSNLTDEDEVGNFLEAIQCMKRYAEEGHRNVQHTIDMMIDQFVVGGDGAENQETIQTRDIKDTYQSGDCNDKEDIERESNGQEQSVEDIDKETTKAFDKISAEIQALKEERLAMDEEFVLYRNKHETENRNIKRFWEIAARFTIDEVKEILRVAACTTRDMKQPQYYNMDDIMEMLLRANSTHALEMIEEICTTNFGKSNEMLMIELMERLNYHKMMILNDDTTAVFESGSGLGKGTEYDTGQEAVSDVDKIGCSITETLNIDENAVLVNGTIPDCKTGVMFNVEDADECLYDIRKLFQFEDELMQYDDSTEESLESELETDDVANACCQSGRSTCSIKRLFDNEYEKVKSPDEETDALENAVPNSSRSERYFGIRADSRNADGINKELAFASSSREVVSRCKSATFIESVKMDVPISKSFDSLDYKALVLPGNRECGMPWHNLTSEVDKRDIEQTTTECSGRSGEKAMNGCEKSVAISTKCPDIKHVSDDAVVCKGEHADTSGIEEIETSLKETYHDQNSRRNDESCHDKMHELDGTGMSMSLKQLCDNSDYDVLREKAECDVWNMYSMNDGRHMDALANIEKAKSSTPGEFHEKIEDVCLDIYGRSVDKNVATMKKNIINTTVGKTFANLQLEHDNNRIEDRKEELNSTDEPLKVVYLMHNRRKSAIPPSEQKPNEDIGKYIQIEKDAVNCVDRKKELQHDSPLRGPEARSIFKHKDVVNTRKFETQYEALTCPRNTDLERKSYSYSKPRHPLNGLNAKNDTKVIDVKGLRIDGTNLNEPKPSNRRKLPMRSSGTIKLITRNDLPNVRSSKKHSVEVENTKRDILDVFSPMNNQQRPPALRGLNIGSYSNKGRQNALNPHQLLPSIRPDADKPRGVNERLSNSTNIEKTQSVDCLTSPLPPIKSRHIKRYGK